ncbi:NO-inducible flavohemoprotein [Pseudoalteromonas sp. APAL1]|uniref:NO-inducible flavohemoprotein n=1 Tax=Pseudoalteromonas sp. APAL1 TaxID=2908883 RepID=UPI001F23A191|nr:NO-inducible flavohemoprotein [Pseudoalteromonas sp. APAL1]MCF2920081.1 NO-inducible flavohemoprotein [Pseudoalteromonas sp. APAL1]
MLSEKTIQIVKSTLPLLAQAGPQVTEYFYDRMFSYNPELKNIFNMTHQQSGTQQFALFNALAAYAANIDNLAVLKGALARINHKHTSCHILPEHYPIVGGHLIATLKELLPEQFTPEVEYAWREACSLLADVCINEEMALYQTTKKAPGGWFGTRTFTITEKRMESAQICSFTLTPVDAKPVVAYLPGQYLGIKVTPANSDLTQVRQYSLSQQSNGRNYRISVKKEGLVSNYLHSLTEGDEVEIYPPAGDFVLREIDFPVVLISAGVGQTPMMAMLETLLSNQHNQPIHYLHACDSETQFAFKEYLLKQQQAHASLHCVTWFKDGKGGDFAGLMDINHIAASLPISKGDFYLCGPIAFMAMIKEQLLSLGVASERIHYEVFGPHQQL